jgi:6-phosphogluconolactonase (cycloisomerase 2 family)
MRLTRNLLVATAVAMAVSAPALATNGDLRTGAVFVMTNQTNNEVIAYDRNTDGTLVEVGRFSTGGRGSITPHGTDLPGNPLASQGSLIVSDDGRFLLAVNTASNSLSVMKIGKTSLSLVSSLNTGGQRPISVANFSSLVYVMNELHAGNIVGFILGPFGVLSRLPNSTRDFPGGTSDPAQVAISGDGRLLAVTDKLANTVTVYPVRDSGRTDPPIATPSSGTGPFGAVFDGRGHLIVAEAANAAAGASSVSSYGLHADGTLDPVSVAVPDSQTSAGQIVITNDAKFAYVSNTAGGDISSYSVASDGQLTLLASVATNLPADADPTDLALSSDSQFLYVIQGGRHSIAIFAVQSDGSLVRLTGKGGLPVGAQGIAAN